MAYNLSSEGPEANRNAGYTAPTNYAGPAIPGAGGAPAAGSWENWANTNATKPVTPEGPHLNFISKNYWGYGDAEYYDKGESGPSLGIGDLSPYNMETRTVLRAIAKDAAKSGLTAWGFSVLKRLGQPIKPEWLKNSKEWFNKPLPDPTRPPKEDFIKIIDPELKPQVMDGTGGKRISPGGPGDLLRSGLYEQYHPGDTPETRQAAYDKQLQEVAKQRGVDLNTQEGFVDLRDNWQSYQQGADATRTPEQIAATNSYLQKVGWKATDPYKVNDGSGPVDATFVRPDFVPGTNYFPTGGPSTGNAIEAGNLPGAGGTGLAGAPMSAEEYDRIHPVPQNVRDAIAAWRKDHPIPNNEYVNEQNPPAGMTRKQARQANKDMEAAFRADAAGRQAYIQKYAPNEARVYGGALTPYDKDIFASLPDTLGGSPKTPPAPPVTPFVPSGQSPDTAQAGLINAIQRGSTGPPPVGTGNTFLPPYLQPGGINGRRPLGFTEGVTPFDSSLGTPVRETSRTSYEGIPDVGALTGPAAFTPTGALTPPGSPVTPFAPTGQAPGIAVGETPIITGGFMDAPGRDPIQGSEYRAPRGTPVSVNSVLQQYGYSRPAAPTNFLPPYLQPGAGATQGQPSALLDIGAPPGSWDQIINGVQQIPGQITPPGSPLTPFVPQGIAPPGSPLTPFVPQAMAGMPGGGFGGGFAATAKLLELPFYLRNFGKPRRGIYG